MHDLVVRGGMLVDGTGSPPRQADVAIQDGRIAEVGEVTGSGRDEIAAKGMLVTPGFVDIHTHYDGQATWDSLLAPSCYHGVTTVVMGNCGVGFAPVHPGQEDFLIQLMEGVEDIPGAALHEGIAWNWETFPEYLDCLDGLRFSMDLGTQVPHGSVRTYVMGERGANNEPATAEDIAAMAAIVKEGIAAGALGFSTSRTIAHRAITGEPVPGTFAAEDELFGIGRMLGELGTGVFEVAGAGAAGEDVAAPKAELDWMRRLSAEIQRPVSFAMLQVDTAPRLWRELLDLSAQATAEGAQLFPQVAGRPFGMLVGHQTDIHPFSDRPTFAKLRELPFEERIAQLRDPAVKRQILSETPDEPSLLLSRLGKWFPMGDPPNYEPCYEDSIEALATRAGRDPVELLYDKLLEKDGKELLLLPVLNYSDLIADPIREMIYHPNAALGLGDGGAHCGIICDASIQTFMLTHWVRDRTRGERVPIEFAVKRMTMDTASLYGLGDRGVVAPGMKGDLNVIDHDALRLELPEMIFDLPAGGKRLMQRARGYQATIVSGTVTMREDEPTGELPGRLIRGARA
ncbi:MAG: amidohydrolase family protein [Deltaproteobacteria bacterium]|nr:amidohydrolase family protein [Deltaproteobacteria bacterium]MBW2394574.1 amidohydrolase family protein [Deltaproteobacteria bacterium]